MRRKTIIGFGILGVVLIILTGALASVGTNLDKARIERADLQSEVDDLNQEVDTLTEDRQKLQTQVDEQLKSIEQLKADLERTRHQVQGQAAAPAPEPASAAPSATH